MHYFTDVIKKYTVFKGRASRKEYWMFLLFYFILYFVLGIFIGVINASFKINLNFLFIVFVLATALPTYGVSMRRLHDINLSGWWILLSVLSGIMYNIIKMIPQIPKWLSIIIALVSLVISLVYIVLLATKGKPGSNKYGENPLEIKKENPIIPTPETVQ